MTATRALEALTGLVPFLQSRVGEAGEGEVVIADPDDLAAVVAECGRGRGTDDPQVAASLWWQSYAYRVAGTTLAAWVVAGEGPDPSAGVAVRHARHRPAAVAYRSDHAIADLHRLVERTLAALEPVVDALRARHTIARRLLDGDTMSSVASVLGAVTGADAGLAPRADLVRAALPAAVTRTMAGSRRTACCLWWKTAESGGRLCADCSLDPGTVST